MKYLLEPKPRTYSPKPETPKEHKSGKNGSKKKDSAEALDPDTIFEIYTEPRLFSVQFESNEEAFALSSSSEIGQKLQTGGDIPETLLIPTLQQLSRRWSNYGQETYPLIIDIPPSGIDAKSKDFIKALRVYADSIHRLTGENMPRKEEAVKTDAWRKSSQFVTLVLRKEGRYYGLILLYDLKESGWSPLSKSQGKAILVDPNPFALDMQSLAPYAVSRIRSLGRLTHEAIGEDAEKIVSMFMRGPMRIVHSIKCMNGESLPQKAYGHYFKVHETYSAEQLFLCAMNEAYVRYQLYNTSKRLPAHNYGDLPYAPSLSTLMDLALAHKAVDASQFTVVSLDDMAPGASDDELELVVPAATSSRFPAFDRFVSSAKAWLSPTAKSDVPPSETLKPEERAKLFLE